MYTYNIHIKGRVLLFYSSSGIQTLGGVVSETAAIAFLARCPPPAVFGDVAGPQACGTAVGTAPVRRQSPFYEPVGVNFLAATPASQDAHGHDDLETFGKTSGTTEVLRLHYRRGVTAH